MKRQVAITGPTPEFLRWSIRRPCQIRYGTDLASVDQTEKRLRAVRAAGCAIKSGHVFDQIAVKKIQGAWKGFRLAEIFQLFGGRRAVEQLCDDCPANAVRREHEIAGCFGWLPRTIENYDCAEALESSCTPEWKVAVSNQLLHTTPMWYGLWAQGQISGQLLELVLGIFERAMESAKTPETFNDFVDVLRTCLNHDLTLDCELVPAGHSDGLRWTLSPYCEQCKAPARPQQNHCAVCLKTGRGHPEVHRKVLGLRPWIDLNVVLGPEKALALLKARGLS